MTHTILPEERDNALIEVHVQFALLDIHARREYHLRSLGQITRHIAVDFMAEMKGNRGVFADHYYLRG